VARLGCWTALDRRASPVTAPRLAHNEHGTGLRRWGDTVDWESDLKPRAGPRPKTQRRSVTLRQHQTQNGTTAVPAVAAASGRLGGVGTGGEGEKKKRKRKGGGKKKGGGGKGEKGGEKRERKKKKGGGRRGKKGGKEKGGKTETTPWTDWKKSTNCRARKQSWEDYWMTGGARHHLPGAVYYEAAPDPPAGEEV